MIVRYGDLIRIGRGKQQKSGEKSAPVYDLLQKT